jgi:DNA-binding transcriptional LysR family regulator
MIDEISGDFFQWLRGFYFVTEKGSVRQAAIAMRRESSTISRQIQCLEKELGVTLFDRSSGKMMITPKGKILREATDALFEDIKRIKGELKDEVINYQGQLAIAATRMIMKSVLQPYIEDFWRLHPGVTFHCEGGSSDMVYAMVESGEVDFGITIYDFFDARHRTLVYQHLYENGLIMIAAKNNPYFAGKAIPTLMQIAAVPLILRDSNRSMIERRFAEEKLKPLEIMTHNNIPSVKTYVAHGMGVAILSALTISKEDEQNLDIYDLDRYFPKKKYGIILKKNKYLSPMVKAFIRSIKPDIDFSANSEP